MPDDFTSHFEAAKAQREPRTPAPFDPRQATAFDLRDPRQWNGQPPARRWAVRDWVPRGTVTALYGDGGVGKSLLAQQLLTCTALALPWLGMETAGGRALGIMCEDDDDELHRRQTAINASLNVSMENLENLRLLSRVGENNVVMTFAQRTGIGDLTEAFWRIDKTCEFFKPTLVVGDTIADFFGGSEIDRGHVRQFVQNAWGNIARRHGCAVLLCGHPSASGINTGSGTGGSTAWSNTVRSRLYLSRPPEKEGEDYDPDLRLLARMKANYAPRQAEVTLRYVDGVLVERDAAGGTKATLEWTDIEKLFEEIARAWHAGKPWSLATQTKNDGRFFPLWAEKHLGLAERVVMRHCQEWLAGGFLASEMLDARSKLKGLKVVRLLHPGG